MGAIISRVEGVHEYKRVVNALEVAQCNGGLV